MHTALCSRRYIFVPFCLREENSLVQQFVFEVLVVFLESLALAHSDEKALGKRAFIASF